jgi:hypothetical protein
VDTYRIVSTEQSDPPASGHGHILAVGTGTDPKKADHRWTVQEVRRQIAFRTHAQPGLCYDDVGEGIAAAAPSATDYATIARRDV